MTPIVILFWPAAGILLRWLVPLMLLDAGRERWARAAGPGPWPARLALFAAVLAPFAAGGVWAPRLMLLAVGYAAGWDAIPRPHHGTRRDRPVRTRVPWAAMTGQGHITIRPFLIGHGVFDADPARYFHRDASWRRDRSPFRYSERSLVMGRTAGDSAMLMVMGRATGLSASVCVAGRERRGLMDGMRSRRVPYPGWTYRTGDAEDLDMTVRACMLRYGATLILDRARTLEDSARPRLAWLRYGLMFGPVRRSLNTAGRYPLIAREGWDVTVRDACVEYDRLRRTYGPTGLLSPLLDIVVKVRDALG